MKHKLAIFGGIAVAAVAGLAVTYNSLVGYNESGERRFVQEYFGDEKVVFKPGPFGLYGGKDEPYGNVLTLNNTGKDGKCEYERGDGFKVQYADGGYGSICVQAQFPLPEDEPTMIAMHKRYYSQAGIGNKLILPTLQSMYTTTAKLYTSTEAYSTKSAEIQNDSKFQVLNGQYVTKIEPRQIEAGVDDKGQVIYQTKDVAVKLEEGGVPQTSSNPFDEWGLSQTISIQITGFDFEKKTIDQIGLRRDATNRAETAQANAKAAYWETEQKKADGERNRVEKEFEEKTKAEVEIQEAEKQKRLTLIAATRKKEEAIELAAAAIEKLKQKKADVKTAEQTAKEMEILSKAEAEKINRLQQAGELFKRIDAEIVMNAANAEALKERKVPSTVYITTGESGKGNLNDDIGALLGTQLIKNAKATAPGKEN